MEVRGDAGRDVEVRGDAGRDVEVEWVTRVRLHLSEPEAEIEQHESEQEQDAGDEGGGEPFGGRRLVGEVTTEAVDPGVPDRDGRDEEADQTRAECGG